MLFKQIPIGPMQNFAYIIGDESSKIGAIVDPGWEIGKLLKIAEENNLKIGLILLTHTHFDHVTGLAELAKKTNAKIYVHEKEVHELIKLKEQVIQIKDKDIIKIGKLTVKVIHTPGHTQGSVCFLIDKKIITGDTIFIEAVGRTDLPGGNSEQLFESLQKIKKLDDTIEIYPGHDYGSVPFATIKHQKENNPYLQNGKLFKQLNNLYNYEPGNEKLPL